MGTTRLKQFTQYVRGYLKRLHLEGWTVFFEEKPLGPGSGAEVSIISPTRRAIFRLDTIETTIQGPALQAGQVVYLTPFPPKRLALHEVLHLLVNDYEDFVTQFIPEDSRAWANRLLEQLVESLVALDA